MRGRKSKGGKNTDGMEGKVRTDGKTNNSKIEFAYQKKEQNSNNINFVTAKRTV